MYFLYYKTCILYICTCIFSVKMRGGGGICMLCTCTWMFVLQLPLIHPLPVSPRYVWTCRDGPWSPRYDDAASWYAYDGDEPGRVPSHARPSYRPLLLQPLYGRRHGILWYSDSSWHCASTYVHVLYMYLHVYSYTVFVWPGTCIHVHEEIKNHNSLGRDKQSPDAQDTFWPIPGLISYAGVTGNVGITCHASGA